jgi:TfoX/Sxy family transcriptional regulator of competence genes
MPSSQSTVDALLAAVADAGPVTTRKMFGEYCVYLGGKVVGIVADDEFFLKPTTVGRRLAPKVEEKAPYPGAKPFLLVPKRKWSDADWMSGLLAATADELPEPRKKKPK